MTTEGPDLKTRVAALATQILLEYRIAGFEALSDIAAERAKETAGSSQEEIFETLAIALLDKNHPDHTETKGLLSHLPARTTPTPHLDALPPHEAAALRAISMRLLPDHAQRLAESFAGISTQKDHPDHPSIHRMMRHELQKTAPILAVVGEKAHDGSLQRGGRDWLEPLSRHA